MPFVPEVENEIPTLGYGVVDWMLDNLAMPDRIDFEPITFYREMVEFILDWYALDPVTCRRRYTRGVLSRPRGWAKALALDTVLPTPTGWTTIGNITPGDIVFSADGSQTTVIAKTPVWKNSDCYRVTFSDHESIVVSGEHLWTVEDKNRKSAHGKTHGEVTLNTRELLRTYRCGARQECRYRVQMPNPLDLKEIELPLDPYVLGVWLGDGDSDQGRITTPDQGIIDEINKAGFKTVHQQRLRHGVYGLRKVLRLMGLLKNKHIPAEYLRASSDQRWALLQGLIDTDGYIEKHASKIVTVIPKLRDGIEELLASLGIKFVTYSERAMLNGKDCGPMWRIAFHAQINTPIARLPRRLTRMAPVSDKRRLFCTRRIVNVEKVPSVPTACIEVDAPDHLFLVGRKMVQTHNSPIMAALACAEAIGAPVVPAGWDANGRPVGMPWYDKRRPDVQIAAVSEDQTANTWTPLLECLREEAPVHRNYPGIMPMQTFVDMPGGFGKIKRLTASPMSIKGKPACLIILDQTEAWVATNKGHKLAIALRANVAKGDGTSLESPNAFVPGDDSVAQQSADFWAKICEGTAVDNTLYYNHREAPATIDVEDIPSLIAGLRIAYGDSSAHPDGCVIHEPPCEPGHVNLDRLVSTILDPAQPIQNSRSDFLNQITHHSDAWMSAPDWNACYRGDRIIHDGDAITLGFDGSKGRARGKADATALIGCRVKDGHMFEVKVWEQPNGAEGKHWTPPVLEVDAAVRRCFELYNVVGFYADPNAWTEYIVKWEAAFARRLKVKAAGSNPMMIWPSGKKPEVTHNVERLRVAIVESAAGWRAQEIDPESPTPEFSHDGSFYLTKHVLNARQRNNPSGYLLYKAYSESWDKIDAAYAAVMAWRARLDAISRRVGDAPKAGQMVTL